MRRLTLLVTLALLLGAVPAVTAPASATEPTRADVQTRAAVKSGTPLELLATTPAVPPLRVGYKSGLFPNLASPVRDARGCTLRNQMLIKLATVKPKVGKGCTLVGGVWYADFGRTKVTSASKMRLAKLVPDVYVYGQGASQWTKAQRDAYITVLPQSKATPGASARTKPMPILKINTSILPTPNSLALITNKTIPFFKDMDQILMESSPTERSLNELKQLFPTTFQDWSVATVLNAQAWGLSLSPELYANFGVTFRQCALSPRMGLRTRPMPAVVDTVNPCTANYVVRPTGAALEIVAVPQQASTVPVTRDAVLTGYGTPTGDTVSRFLFGIHAPANWFSDEASGADGPIYPETIPTVPVGYLRLWDTETTWKDIQPSKGQFVWRKLDKQIQMGQQLDARVMLVLGQTPAWAGSSPTSMPNSIDDWRTYVREVCTHYGPSISAYEVWNEANLQTFWTGTPSQMADLTKAAFEEIRKCNPSAQVVAANTTTRASGSFGTFFPQYLQELKSRGWPADAYSVHSYPTASGGADARIQGIGQFRTALALSGAPFTTVYDTEINYGLAGLGEGKVDITGDRAMTLLSRTYIDSVRYGFGSTFWFVWTANPDSKFGIQFTRDATAERQAWNSTYDWLVGSRFQRCELTTLGVTVCQFSKGAENFSIVWRGDVGSEPGQLPAGYLSGLGSRACELSNRCTDFDQTTQLTIGPSPVRIDGPATSQATSKGPSDTATPTSPAQPAGSVRPDAPVITSLDLEYGTSNKADGTAVWAPPANAQEARVTGYAYAWLKCGTNGSCSRTCTTTRGCAVVVSSGRTGPATFRVTVPLTEGPGAYQFEVAAISTLATSSDATQRIDLKRSDAAPPDTVIVGVRSDKGEVVWGAPKMRANLIAGYEVQVRNTPSGEWVTVAAKAKDPRVGFSGSAKLNLAVGQTIIARVRTILTSGATSIFVPSDPLEITGAILPPTPLYTAYSSIASKRLGYILAVPDPNTRPIDFPNAGYLIRYSTNGTDWSLARFGGELIGNTKPSANDTIFPYSVANVVFGSAADALLIPPDARYQIRAIDNTGATPSEWIDLPMPTSGQFWLNPMLDN